MSRPRKVDVVFTGFSDTAPRHKTYAVSIDGARVSYEGDAMNVPEREAYFIAGTVVSMLVAEGKDVTHPFSEGTVP